MGKALGKIFGGIVKVVVVLNILKPLGKLGIKEMEKFKRKHGGVVYRI